MTRAHILRMCASAALGMLALAGTATPASADTTMKVLSRNIYLGADVGVALKLIPDMPAAAQFMWEQVAQTDFTSRAPVLAAELAEQRPDVVAIQEATTWLCRPTFFGSSTVVFDFTQQLLDATAATGVEYVLASHDGVTAVNPGYSIPVLPQLTTVTDPATFQPLFGTDEAACGFTIGDALLVRSDLADSVTAVGSGDYSVKYAVVPVVFEIDRGYVWADLDIGDSAVRVLTTHLDSAWDPGTAPVAAEQARELVAMSQDWTMPLVVIGDFNNDPRDPRPIGAPNPGGQPDASTGCAAQVENPTASSADDSCNSYWTMINAGFQDAGPDSLDPINNTWGASALLAGPDVERVRSATANEFGFTDRLDYVFTKNGISIQSADIFGNVWPNGKDMWACSSPEQIANAQEAAGILGVGLPQAFCLPTDHAGLVVSLSVPAGSAIPESDTARSGVRVLAVAGGVMLALLVVVAVRRAARR